MDTLTLTFASGARPLYEQLYRRIADEIASGRLQAGEKLPSKRALGAHLQISVNTVDGAYRMLADEGYLESRPRSGFFVLALPKPLAAPAPRPAAAANPPPAGAACRYDLRTGLVDPDTFQPDLWLKLARKVMPRMGAHLAAGDPQGERSLREGLTRHLREFRALDASPDQMVVGAGMEYLLGLLAKLTGDGAVYALEDPGYPKLRTVLANSGVAHRFVGMDAAGMRPDLLRASGADVAYVTPTHQYPMGITMPVGRRLELIAWAEERRGRYIVEDDYDSEFRYAGRPVPSMTGLTSSEKVVYIGTMSRSLAPSTRCAYMVLPPTLLTAFRRRFGTYACTVSMLEQHLLAEFIGGGLLVRHLNRARTLYRRRRERLLAELERAFGDRLRIHGANVGLHLLATLAGGPGEKAMKARAAEQGVRLAGVTDYAASEAAHTTRNTVVVGYAALRDAEIAPAVRRLAVAWGTN
jgi:GntR family transcriptional regulator/MocR family aminotransferase